jgi:hypothetical protein
MVWLSTDERKLGPLGSSANLATMRHFYSDILELPVTYERANWIQFKLQNVTIALRPHGEPLVASSKSNSRDGRAQLAFCVSCAEVDRWIEKLSALGVSFWIRLMIKAGGIERPILLTLKETS